MSKQRTANSVQKPKTALPHIVLKRLSEGSFILVLTCTLFVLLSLVTYKTSDPGLFHPTTQGLIANAGGQVGAYIADAFYLAFGFFAYVIPFCFAYIAWVILQDHRALKSVDKPMLMLRGIGFVLLLLGGCGLFDLQIQLQSVIQIENAGGVIGQVIAKLLNRGFNPEGATLILVAMVLIGTTWLTGFSWIKGIEYLGYSTLCAFNALKNILVKGVTFCQSFFKSMSFTPSEKPAIRARPTLDVVPKRERVVSPDLNVMPEKPIEKVSKPAAPAPSSVPGAAVAQARVKPVVDGALPSLSLLSKGQPGKPMGGYTHHELETLSREVEQHLLDFGIQVHVVSVHPGPVITRFELQLAAGVKVSRLTALAKDLARSLSVTSVRVVEIIPGKTVVGIELPNQNRAMVSLSDVLSAEVYQQAHSPLTLALGVDIAGHPMVVDLAKMPHLLVAGTTGSGKSVGINAMILSLLFKSTPDQVRLIMVDPKMLELSVYDGIPHLLTPVVTDMKEAASALRWCVAEMERRYRLMASMGVRNLAGFNAKVTEAMANNEVLTDPLWKPVHSMDETAPALTTLPYVVVIIDELADMMMVVGKKVEQLIARIAQKARAAGIHLILATQRPSVDVLTGLIKSNIPTRISFQVSSKIDSRTILDQQGAEQLLGHGDMLFLAPGTGAPLRVHGAFVDDKEVHRIADDWRLRGEPDYIDEITQFADPSEGGFNEEGQATEEADKLYDEAVEFVIQTRKASISAVQRRFKIGYNRAARLVEEMERTGVVGPLDGGMRDVLVSSLERE